MEIGEKIRDARISKGLTQEELGAMVGVQKSAVAKWEKGRVQNIKRKTLQQLAKCLDLKGSDLIIEEEPIETAKLTAAVINDIDVLEMLELYLQLDDADKQTVKELIQRLIK